MSRYMLQHKSFSTLLFSCNMVLFGGLFSIPVFFLHYTLVIADEPTSSGLSSTTWTSIT